METTFKLALGQMLVEGGAVGRNLARARETIREASAKGCQVVVLPECLDFGWTNPAARHLAQPIPGRPSDQLCQAAQDASLFVVAGLTERQGQQIYNAAILISPEGTILLKHHKINILDIAQDLYATGRSLCVTATPFGMFGLAICADNFSSSQVLAHSLARMGARVLLSPCAWAVQPKHELTREPPATQEWIDSYTTLARLYDLTVVGVSNVGRLEAGPWKGYRCIGGSLAVGPGGKILAQCPHGEDAEVVEVVEVSVVEQSITGTNFAPMLAQKGYRGP